MRYFENIAELLHDRALEHPQRRVFTYLQDGDTTEIHLTYHDLDQKARMTATHIRAMGGKPGDRAILLYPTGLDYIIALFGCLYAGLIAVPAYPPKGKRHIGRLQAIAEDAQPEFVLCASSSHEYTKNSLTNSISCLNSSHWIDTGEITSEPAAIKNCTPHQSSEDSLAFLQYTSGSTGSPKGVMVSHKNVMANQHMIQRAFQVSEDSIVVGWLPLYHDMGLVGNVLQPVYSGASCVLMAPNHFVQQPFRWLSAISRYQASISGGPNFAYDLCIDRITPEQKSVLDLSSWTVAFNGAETVRADVLERFCRNFEAKGFKNEAWYPCYGLAEATLFVTGSDLKSPPKIKTWSKPAGCEEREVTFANTDVVRTVVSCGRPTSEQKVIVVDPESSALRKEGEEGEIWIQGPHVTQGYWQGPDETKKTFFGQTSSFEGFFLRTGDLGFLQDNELFVTGRIKDMMIIRGRNYYPQDIEWTVGRSHPSLQTGACAAFSIERDRIERAIVVHEAPRNHKRLRLDQVADAIRIAISEDYELELDSIVFVKHGSIPKTSSGKIQRLACRAQYNSGRLPILSEWCLDDRKTIPATSPISSTTFTTPDSFLTWFYTWLSKQLIIATKEVNPDLPLASHGLSSIRMIELMHDLETALDIEIPQVSFYDHSNLSQLAKDIFDSLTRKTRKFAVKQQRAEPTSETPHTYELSQGQQGLWFLSKLAPESAAYNIARGLRIHGPVNIEALSNSFNKLIKRHDQLRAVYKESRGDPVQVLQTSSQCDFEVHVASDLAEHDIHARLAYHAQKPFDLGSGPPFRVRLFSQKPDSHILLMVVHHIVADLWSLTMLLYELRELYTAELEGREPELKPLKLQYMDYVRWQKQWLESTEAKEQWLYWKNRLEGEMPVLNLPTDHPRRSIQTYKGATLSVQTPAELARRLKDIARDRRTTLNAVLTAAYQVLLHRYTDQDDLIVGTVTAGRPHADFAGILGYFINPVALRTDMSGNPSFENLLTQTGAVIRGALGNQNYPFDCLVERLQLRRDSSIHPVFQSMFVFQEAPRQYAQSIDALSLGISGSQISMGELSMESVAVDQQASQFDVTMRVAETEDELTVTVEYNTDLFESDTITRFLNHFTQLLKGISDDPKCRILDLPFVPDEERKCLLDWAGGDEKHAQKQCLQHRVERIAEIMPDAIALQMEGQQWTYSALNQRANEIAYKLLSCGVKPEVPVGLYVERSCDMIIGILSIVKAGGMYVPLDSEAPEERITFMLKDSGLKILLTQSDLLATLPDHRTKTICLDADCAPKSMDLANPEVAISSETAAYLIYTSGSTGRPKGVVVSHANVLRLFEATKEWFRFDRTDVWTFFHSYAFDFSVWEMWGALLYGGRLIVTPHEVSRSPEQFFELLIRHRVSILSQTPSAFRQLVKIATKHQRSMLTALRYIVLGGEALELATLKPWYDRYKGEAPMLVNMYGITETTVHVTFRPISRADSLDTAASPIGKPIPDLGVYLLDRNGRLGPIGVAGEIYVGGAGVTRGYLNRPCLSSERFVPNPYSSNSGSRMYKSGDFARRLSDGSLVYLGRRDRQVKIRGFRIELAEVEAVLMQHAAIHEAVVIVRKNKSEEKQKLHHLSLTEGPLPSGRKLRSFLNMSGQEEENEDDRKRLIAYLIGDRISMPNHSDLRQFIRGYLPEYMIPQVFVTVEKLPLTVNGKLDYRALPPPDNTRPEVDTPYVAPRNDTERALARIWSQVLNMDRVGIDDGFFSLGGDSIRSIKVRSLALTQGIKFPLQHVFQFQTIRRLASNVTIRKTASSVEPLSKSLSFVSSADRASLPATVEDAYPLSRMQAGVIHHNLLQPEAPLYHDIYLYHIGGCLDVSRFFSAVQQIVARHPLLRTSINLTDYSEPLQLVHRHVTIPFEVMDLRSLNWEQQTTVLGHWLDLEKANPPTWESAPLIRFVLHHLTDETFYLALSFHVSLMDGWSAASLLTELLRHYCDLLKDIPIQPSLPPTITYRDFVRLERETLASESMRDYWRLKLQDCMVSSLPRLDRGCPRDSNAPFRVLEVPITSKVSDRLEALARQIGVPLKHVLLAAHSRIISNLTGQMDLLTGLELGGRLEEEGGELPIGIHTNTVPFRIQSAPGSWIDLIRQIFEIEQDLWPYRRYPYAQIQKDYGEDAILETGFNYTYFHVFKNLSETSNLSILGGKGFSQTHFAFRAEFNRNPFLDQIQLDIEGDLSKLCAPQMEAIRGYYKKTLEDMTEDPSVNFHTHTPLSGAEKHQLLVEWNDTRIDYPPIDNLNGFLERQASQNPDTVAVVYEDQMLSYFELNRRSNKLAHYLRSSGIGPDVLVGLYMERSVDMVVGLWGILKAGGAYVPLDPEYPDQRLQYMFEDAALPVILTQEHLLNSLPDYQAIYLCLDAHWDQIAALDDRNPNHSTAPNNLAYMMYTSGSTGRPKGVMNTHEGICNRLLWMQDVYGLSQTDRVLQKTPFSFDVSVWEFFWPAITGACLVVTKPGGHRDPVYLVDTIAKHRITTLHFVPSMLAAFLEVSHVTQCTGLRRVICSGETLSTELQNRFFKCLDTELHNLYGPTEAAIDVSYWACQRDWNNAAIPIGRAISNTELYILDAYLNPVPIGVAGELCIAGAGLARGYHRQPALTSERFIANPFGEDPGTRCYRTGDAARFQPDGTIEFTGRLDHQVKIRGFRIELGEVEACLAKHEAIQENVVVVRTDGKTSKLAAYFVLQDSKIVPTFEIRSFLQQMLPDYMIPTSFIMLDAMPLTPNGKIDRRALPEPEPDRSGLENVYVAPRDEKERILADVISDTLGIDKIGVDDDYFEIGGDSILSIQIISRAGRLGINLTTRDLFEHRTIAKLAKVATVEHAAENTEEETAFDAFGWDKSDVSQINAAISESEIEAYE